MSLSQVSPELIERCRDGGEAPIEELLKEISPDLYRILFSMLRDHDNTDEVLQETLVRVFRYIGSLKDIERFSSWVMRIAVNQVQTFRVRKGRSRLYEIDDSREISNSAIVLSGSAPENGRDKIERDQLRDEISRAIETLPLRQRLATVLFEVEGLSIRETAEILECSEGAVKFNIHEGRKKLKRRLYHLVKGLRWSRQRALESGPDWAFGDGSSDGSPAPEKRTAQDGSGAT